MSYPMVAENTFHKNFQQNVNVRDYRKNENGVRITAWRGIIIRQNEEKKEDVKIEEEFVK